MAQTKEQKRAYDKAWHIANRQKRLDHYAANRETVKAKARTYYITSRGKVRLQRGQPLPTRNQPPLCECCGRPPQRAMHLDHCHVTGLFRGWLCGKCNQGIGLLGDNEAGVMNALRYLQKFLTLTNGG